MSNSKGLLLKIFVLFSIERPVRSVTSRSTMVAKVLDHNKRKFCNGDGKLQKNNRFRVTKEQLYTCSKLFCTFQA